MFHMFVVQRNEQNVEQATGGYFELFLWLRKSSDGPVEPEQLCGYHSAVLSWTTRMVLTKQSTNIKLDDIRINIFDPSLMEFGYCYICQWNKRIEIRRMNWLWRGKKTSSSEKSLPKWQHLENGLENRLFCHEL